MNQEWILSEVIKDNPRAEVDAPDETQNPLHAFFIDTDESTLPSDLESRINTTVERIAEENNLTRYPDVDGTVINLAKGPHEQYLQPEQVTAQSTISEMAEDLGLDAWWLSRGDENDLLGPLSGLSKGGVSRKRGLMKAISRISEWQNDSLDQVVQSVRNQSTPDVAMVVGIGGGTGSGTFLDLSRRIKEAGSEITLFVILPTPSGRDESTELGNAYAGLSELEYLALSDENYFENIVLMPYDPAVDANIFDKAATYTITSYYNLSDSQTNTYSIFDETDEFDGPPKFAPFTLASTRFLHYLKEDIDETRDSFNTYINAKENALSIEENLYDDIADYLKSHHSDAAKQLYSTRGEPSIRLPSGKALSMRERLDDIHDLLNISFIEEIEFWSATNLSTAFEEIEVTSEDQASWEDDSDKAAAIARDFIQRLADNINDVGAFEPQEGEWSPNEQKFVKQTIDEFELVARRAGIIRAVNAIREGDEEGEYEAIAVDIENAIDPDHSGYGAETENEVSSVDGEIDDLEAEIETLETIIEGADSEVGKIVDDWGNTIEDDIDEYYSLYETKSEIDSLLDDLKDKVASEVVGLSNKRESDNIDIEGTDFQEYDRLNTLLSQVGGDEVDKNLIETSVKKTKRARQKQLLAQERSGTTKETILGLLNRGSIGGLRTDYNRCKDDRIDSQLIRIPDWSADFDVTIQDGYFHDRSSSLEDQKEDLQNSITDATRTAIDTAEKRREKPDEWLDDGDAVAYVNDFGFADQSVTASSITNHLEKEADAIENASTAKQLREALKSGAVTDLVAEALKSPFSDRKEEKSNERDAKQETKKQYKEIKQIVTDSGGEYQAATENVPTVGSIATYQEVGETDPFKIDMVPASRGRVGNSTDLGDTELWNHGEEQAEILNKLTDIVPNLGDEYLPVNEAYLADGDTDQVQYEGHRTATSFMSPLFDEFTEDQAAEIPDVTNELIDNRHPITLDRASRGAFADDYDFSMTTFLGGVFLDNLRLFTEDCRDAYLKNTDVSAVDDRENELQSVPKIVQSHTYGLDGVIYHTEDGFLPDQSDGGFAYRKDIMNFETDGTKVLLDQAEEPEQNNEQVAETLRTEYYETVGYPSAIDLE